MAANTPSKPHTEGMEWTNEETGIKYQFSGGGWRAVSSEASEEVADAISKLDLETVLTNGNIADEGIVLTNASDDALLLSPEEARIMVGGIGSNVVPRIELRHKTGIQDTSIVKLELDEDGERFDIECDEKVDNIHFRFENDVAFELNKNGDAKFGGGAEFKDRVTIDRSPLGESNSFIVKGGIRNSNNDVVIGSMLRAYHDAGDLTKDSGMEYKGKIFNSSNLVNKGYVDTADEVHETAIGDLQGSVAVLQKEIEALSEVLNKSVPHNLIRSTDDVQNLLRNGGIYFGDCPNGNILDIPDDWSGICFIYVDTNDSNGDFADFGPDSLDPGDLIEGVSATGYFLVEVGLGGYDENGGKKIAGMQATLIKSSGVPGPAGQGYQLTAFRLTASGGIDLPTADERYVQTTGDSMSGILETTKPIWIRANNEGPNGATNMLVVNQSGADSGSIMRVCQDGEDIIKVQYDKTTTFTGNRIIDIGAPEEDKDAANKAYVDTTVANISGGTEGLFEASYWTLDTSMDRDAVTSGKFHYDGDDFYMARSTAGGHTWCPGAQGWRTTNAWVTIYSKAGELMHTFEVSKINFKEKYGKKYIVEFEDTWSYKTSDLVNGEEYIIVVPGFMT